MQLIILDQHLLDDSRINRHINYLKEKEIKIIRINVNRNICIEKSYTIKNNDLITYVIGINEKYGRYNIIHYIINRLIRNNDIYNTIIESLDVSYQNPTIFHVHDPILLPLAVKISSKFKQKWLVYDRHEVYEKLNKFHSVLYLPKTGRIGEILSMNKIDGVVTILEEYRSVVQKYFPHSKIAVIPNFPVFEDYDDKIIISKINSFTSATPLQFIYIGSLNWNQDRDLELIIYIAEFLLLKSYNVKFIIGGYTSDDILLSEFSRLNTAYPNNFIYTGHLPREKVIKYSQESHFGFFLIKPNTDYWVLSSPNKVFEYIRCGVIPILRANCAHKELLFDSSVWFDRKDPRESILNTIESIISDPNRIQELMRQSYQLSSQFSFNSVAEEYLKLYALIGAELNSA
jgi:hypothetical protein